MLYLQACEVLARAMKEWDRRPRERSGFSASPGDCMAFKHLRDVSVYHNYFVILVLRTLLINALHQFARLSLTFCQSVQTGASGVWYACVAHL